MKKIVLLSALISFVATPYFAHAAETNTKTETMQKVKKAPKKFKGRGSRARARFKNIDKNSDGMISKSEFTNYHTMKFTKKDKNKDGKLSPEELSPVLAKKK